MAQPQPRNPNWRDEGFRARATNAHADLMATTTTNGAAEDRYLCQAIRNAENRIAPLYVQRDSIVPCTADADCAVGNLGGMCNGGYHKEVLQGYALFKESPEYTRLAAKWTEKHCPSRLVMGMCLPVTRAFCERLNNAATGACKGARGDAHTEQPSFMAPRPVNPNPPVRRGLLGRPRQ